MVTLIIASMCDILPEIIVPVGRFFSVGQTGQYNHIYDITVMANIISHPLVFVTRSQSQRGYSWWDLVAATVLFVKSPQHLKFH